MAEPTRAQELQRRGQQAQSRPGRIEQAGHGRNGHHHHLGGKADHGLVQQQGHQQHAYQRAKTDDKGAVPAIEAVQRVSGAAPEGAAPAAHGVGGGHDTLNEPGEEDAAPAEGVAHSLEDISLALSPANTPLGQLNALTLFVQPGNRAQEDG